MDLNEVRQEELYEQFQEWINQCPIKITDYQDNTTEFAVDFSLEDVPVEEPSHVHVRKDLDLL